jgi:DNA modification methylase
VIFPNHERPVLAQSRRIKEGKASSALSLYFRRRRDQGQILSINQRHYREIVWEIANNNPFGTRQGEQSWGHGTQKPVECMRRPIVNNSRPGQIIYDPFLGSGTSLIAAEMTGRICIGLELSPVYVDVILRRWQDFTGRGAIQQASGQSFDERADNEARARSEVGDA